MLPSDPLMVVVLGVISWSDVSQPANITLKLRKKLVTASEKLAVKVNLFTQTEMNTPLTFPLRSLHIIADKTVFCSRSVSGAALSSVPQ